MDDIEKWLRSLSAPPTEEEFTSRIQDILGSAYAGVDTKAVSDVVAEIYSFYKTTDKLIADIEVAFGGADVRTVDFLSKLDSWYLSKYIQNDDAVSVVTDFLKEQYIEGGANIFGGLYDEAMQNFMDLLEQKLIDVDDWQAQRIADTAVQRARNWAHVSQMNDAGITEIVVYEPTRDCAFCQAIDGTVIGVEKAYSTMQDLSQMSPEDYQAYLSNPDNQPRLDNMQSMVDSGMLPPYHPHCRGRIIKRVRG